LLDRADGGHDAVLAQRAALILPWKSPGTVRTRWQDRAVVPVPRRFSAPTRSFAAVLGLIVAAVLFQMAAPDEEWARLVTIGLQGAVVIAALSTAGADRRLMRAARIAIVILFLTSTVTVISFGGVGPAIPRLVGLFLVLLAPFAIAVGMRRELLDDRQITMRTLYGALCMYLLLGLAFAFTYNAIEDLSEQAFFSGGRDGHPADYLYYSFTTMTTTGYGDFTAGTGLGRGLSMIEALAGQIYLVTVVALLVSNLGRTHSGEINPRLKRRIAGEGGESEGDDPGS
jgi:hypothetical protein